MNVGNLVIVQLTHGWHHGVIASAIRGAPAKPFCPVQLGTAVSIKPAIAQTINPNSISCAC